MATNKNHGSSKPEPLFDTSPFSCESMVTLKFETGPSLQVHQDLLHLNPKLAQLADGGKTDYRTRQPIPNAVYDNLRRRSHTAGHVLAHYLYTSVYHTPKWTGPTDTTRKEIIAKFSIAFEVYATARELDLSELEALAKDQIVLLRKDIDAFTIIDIVKKAYPVAKDNDTWLSIFIKDTVRTAFETPSAPLAVEAPCEATSGVTLSKLLLQGAVEVYKEKMDARTSVCNPQLQSDDQQPVLVAKLEKIKLQPELELVPVPEKENDDDLAPTKKEKKGKKARFDLEPEPAPQEENKDDEWVPTKKRMKDKKGRNGKAKAGKSSQPDPEPVEESKSMEEPVPVDEGWVGDSQDSWSL
ncbi:hypothetical protein B0T14DRAFT_565118 [Immersiella caudata]|uniref:Uncharacterized protein n=1 Tax=Immersiella caudata TaxID=314043 RepID=A0AA40C3M2_9PEZI|nr:hypothetical protein B0T14DRAFT_565118 [Immersiella caudata]